MCPVQSKRAIMRDPTEELATAEHLAVRALEDGQLTIADAQFRKLLQLNTPSARRTNALALCGLARIAMLRGDLEIADAYAREALHHRSGAVEAMLILGELADSPYSSAWQHEATTFGTLTRELAGAWQPPKTSKTGDRSRLAALRLFRR